MKKALFVVSMLTTTVLGFSQDKTLRFGVTGGMNVSNIKSTFRYMSFGTNYSTDLPFKSIIGINAGIQAEIPLFNNFFLQPELSYSSMGAKDVYPIYDTTAATNEIVFKSVLHYAVVPVLIKYKIPKTGVGIFLGPQVGYLIGVTNSVSKTTIDEKDESNYKGDFSALFGAEYFLPMGLGVSARYQLGISNIQKPEYIDFSNYPPNISPKSISVRNSAFSFTVGYRF